MRADAPTVARDRLAATGPGAVESQERRRPPWWTAALAVLALLVAVGLALSSSAPRLAGTNDVPAARMVVDVAPDQQWCQSGEQVPRDAAALELLVGTYGRPGPPLRWEVVGADGRTRAEAAVRGGYADGRRLRLELGDAAGDPATVCVTNEGAERLALAGRGAEAHMPPGLAMTLDGEAVPGVVHARYLRAGSESWWAVAPLIAERMGRGSAAGAATPWIALALLVTAAVAALAGLLCARVPGVLACGVAGACAAAAWAFVTPALQVPDEPQHVAYAQYLAETGAPPPGGPGRVFSDEEARVFDALQANIVIGNPETGRPPWTAAEDQAVEAALDAGLDRRSDGAVSNAVNNPPLYYGLQVIPQKLLDGGDFLDRLLGMRLISALLAGLTSAFAFLFVRELLPRSPIAAVAGGLAVAFQPMLGFIGGGVNNDAALFAAGAAVLWLVARAFRRGLDLRVALGLGLALGLGVVGKATLLGFGPGLVVAAALLLRRAPRVRRPAAIRAVLASGAVAAVPVAVYLALNATAWSRAAWQGAGSAAATGTGQAVTLGHFLSHVWQFYLPALPFMTPQFEGGYPLRDVWIKGLVGRFGWLDTELPGFSYYLITGVMALVVAAAVLELWRRRHALRARWDEALGYAVLILGYLAFIHFAGFRGKLDNGFIFEQARYLLPLLAFYGAVVALAIRAAGARRGPQVAVVLVVAAIGHTVLSQLTVIARFHA